VRITPNSFDITTLPSLCLSRRRELPRISAIYFAIDSLGQVQYIGQSTNLRHRWVSHHRQFQLQAIDSVRIAWLQCDDVLLLTGIEKTLITWFEPPLNRMIPVVVHSPIQGMVETEDGKIFDLNSPIGSEWLESVGSFRYEPSGESKPYTVRKEASGYWYGCRKITGKVRKKYIGKSLEVNVAKLEEIAEALEIPPVPRANKVAEIAENRLTALELEVARLRKTFEALQEALPGNLELGDSST
jgi:hypothetical protein